MRSFALTLLLVVSTVALAADEPDPRAVEFFENGAMLYQEARYAEAIEAFEQCYEISGEPALFFNIANARERLGDPAAAVDALNRYRVFATPDERKVLERRIENLERRVAEQKRAADRLAAQQAAALRAREQQAMARQQMAPLVVSQPAPTVWASPPAPPVATVRYVKRTRWLAVVGGALAAVGGTAAGLSYVQSGEYRQMGDKEGWEKARMVNGAGLALTGVGLVTFGVGVAVPIGGKNRSTTARGRRTGAM